MTLAEPAEPFIAVDAMGGDHAPGAIVAGARAAAASGTPVVLVGPPNLGDRVDIGDLPLIAASEVIEMDEDGGRATRDVHARFFVSRSAQGAQELPDAGFVYRPTHSAASSKLTSRRTSAL